MFRGRLLVACLLLAPSVIADIVVRGLMRDMAVVEIDGTRRVLRVGQTSPEGVKLIAAESDQAILERAGKRAVYRLGESVAIRAVPRAKAVTRIVPRKGMYYVEGAIEGKPVGFIVDTGATLVAFSERHAQELGIDYRQGEQTQASTANGPVAAYRVRLKRVRAGRIELRNVEALVLPGDSPFIPLLGMSFLNRVELERRGQVMLLEER